MQNPPNLKLATLRNDKYFSQEYVAGQVGITQANYSLIETGKRDPVKSTKKKLAKFFGVSVGWLFYEESN